MGRAARTCGSNPRSIQRLRGQAEKLAGAVVNRAEECRPPNSMTVSFYFRRTLNRPRAVASETVTSARAPNASRMGPAAQGRTRRLCVRPSTFATQPVCLAREVSVTRCGLVIRYRSADRPTSFDVTSAGRPFRVWARYQSCRAACLFEKAGAWLRRRQCKTRARGPRDRRRETSDEAQARRNSDWRGRALLFAQLHNRRAPEPPAQFARRPRVPQIIVFYPLTELVVHFL